MKAMLVSVVLLAGIAAAQAQSLHSQIEAANQKIVAAMKKKDIPAIAKAIKAGTTANFVYTEAGKSQTFDQMMADMKMGLNSMSKITVCEEKILSLKEKGNTATGTTSHKMGGIATGPDKKPHTMVYMGTSTDQYVKEKGVWKMSKMAWNMTGMTMDGKKMDASAMGK
jgi:hypothetical protein